MRPSDQAIESWFDERVRPFVRNDPDVAGATWGTVASGLGDAALDGIVDRMRRADGAPARTALTILAGWRAGHLAAVLAFGLLRDGVLVRPPALSLLLAPDGWCGDARLIAARPAVVVEAGHPWAPRGHVATVAGAAVLEAAATAQIEAASAPVIDALVRRSGRGRAGLWAQVADGLGDAALALARADPQRRPEDIAAAIERLLRAPGAPWRHVPRFWLADAGDRGPVLVKHRRSCCLSYRCEREARQLPADELDPDWLARFGDEPPRYCDTCLFRTPADVAARTLFAAARA